MEEVGGVVPRGRGVMALDFDPTGTCLASITRSGCLRIFDCCDTLHCQSGLLKVKNLPFKYSRFVELNRQGNAVKWCAGKNEVACASLERDYVCIYDACDLDVGPIVFRIKEDGTRRGISDILFTKDDESRLFACDTRGLVHVWDSRQSSRPCVELTSPRYNAIHSIQLHPDNQTVSSAGSQGVIYMWDLRGGTMSSALQTDHVASYQPLRSLRLSTILMEKIPSLKGGAFILPQEVHAININPSSPHQMAFHLDKGWTGVLDFHYPEVELTHFNCPPTDWLTRHRCELVGLQSYLRKPAWHLQSIFVVGTSTLTSTANGLQLLDFFPGHGSPNFIHADNERAANVRNQLPFIPLREGVTTCAYHPLSSLIAVGTEDSSLLLVDPSISPEA